MCVNGLVYDQAICLHPILFNVVELGYTDTIVEAYQPKCQLNYCLNIPLNISIVNTTFSQYIFIFDPYVLIIPQTIYNIYLVVTPRLLCSK